VRFLPNPDGNSYGGSASTSEGKVDQPPKTLKCYKCGGNHRVAVCPKVKDREELKRIFDNYRQKRLAKKNNQQPVLPSIGENTNTLGALLNNVIECRAALDSCASHTFVPAGMLEKLKKSSTKIVTTVPVAQKVAWVSDGHHL